MKSSVRFSAGNFATKIFLFPIGFLTSILITRFLGPEERGVYAYILVLSSFLIPIFSLGLGAGMRYYVSKSTYSLKEILFTSIACGLSLGIFSCLAIYLAWFMGWLGETGEKLNYFQILLLLVTVLISSMHFFLSRVALGASKFPLINSLEIVRNLVNPFFIILLCYLLNLRIDGILYSLIIVHLLLFLGYWIPLSRGIQLDKSINISFLKKSLKFGLKSWLGDLAIRANVRLDQLILGIIVPATALGFYAVAVTLAELFWLLPDSIGKVLFNRIAREKDNGFQEEMLCRVHRIVFWVSFVLIIIGAVAVTYVIIPYGYGGKYLDSIKPFLLLLPGTLLYIPAKITTKLLSSTGKILETSYATASGSAISIVLYFILIPKFGIIGAAYAASIGYISISIFCIYYVIRDYNISLKDLFSFSGDDLNWILANDKKISPKKSNA